jgi:hypothetical protein
MKKLLITLLLISPASFADWGDVYYCKATTNSFTMFGMTVDRMRVVEGTSLEKKRTFTLRADKSSKALILKQIIKGETRETVLPIKEVDREKLVENDVYVAEASLKFAALSPRYDDDGNIDKFDFLYSWLSHTDARFSSTTMSADCEKI